MTDNEAHITDEELRKAVSEDAAKAREKMSNPADDITESDVEKDDEAFLADFAEYFSEDDLVTLIDDDGKTRYIAKIETMTVRHLLQFKKMLKEAFKKFQGEELIFVDDKLDWQSAAPVMIDIVLDDLLELVVMSCQIQLNGQGEFINLTLEELGNFQHEWLPMIIVPWVRRNFVEPKKRKPWMIAIRAMLKKFLKTNGKKLSSAFQTALQNSQQQDSQSTKSSTDTDQAVD